MKNDYQLPVRLDSSLAKRLHDVSTGTGISKTKLTQISLDKFLSEFNQSGVFDAINKLKEPQVW